MPQRQVRGSHRDSFCHFSRMQIFLSSLLSNFSPGGILLFTSIVQIIVVLAASYLKKVMIYMWHTRYYWVLMTLNLWFLQTRGIQIDKWYLENAFNTGPHSLIYQMRVLLFWYTNQGPHIPIYVNSLTLACFFSKTSKKTAQNWLSKMSYLYDF